MKTARYAAFAIAFLTPAAWLLMLLGCVKGIAPACEPVNLAAAPLAIGALVLLPLGLVYVERARRRAAKGMWLRAAGASWGKNFEHRVDVVWKAGRRAIAWSDAPEELVSGEVRFVRRRWLVPVKNGQRVYVDRREFWLWLDQVETLHRTLPPGESALSERRWKPKLKEGRYLAYCAILDAVGAVEYPTADPRSRRYVSGLAWSRVEEFEKISESEEY